MYAGITFDAELATAVSPIGLRTCDLGIGVHPSLRPRAQKLASDTCVPRYQIRLQGEKWMRLAVAFFARIPSR